MDLWCYSILFWLRMSCCHALIEIVRYRDWRRRKLCNYLRVQAVRVIEFDEVFICDLLACLSRARLEALDDPLSLYEGIAILVLLDIDELDDLVLVLLEVGKVL